MEIKDQHDKLKNHKNELLDTELYLMEELPNYVTKRFFETQFWRLNKIERKNDSVKTEKFDRLDSEKYGANFNAENSNNKWFDNRTGIVIPPKVVDVSLGEKFNLDHEKIHKNDKFEVIECVETNLCKIKEEHHEQVRRDLVNIIQNNSSNLKKMRHVNHFERQIKENIEKTNKFLENNYNILFTRADKGNITVALNRLEYQNAIKGMLSDSNTYERVPGNPLQNIIDKLKELLNRWQSKEYIDFHTHKKMYLTSANLSRAYALPKYIRKKKKQLT